MIKTRTFSDKNYHSVYHGGKTIRIALDPKKEIQELDFPEFYDVKITNFCRGKCPYCYQNSLPTEKQVDVLEKFNKYFGDMSENERPFQIAFGGGEPTEHPDFIPIIKSCHELGITPNYTTNGMNVSPELVAITKEYCGGVAISTHKHLNWEAPLISFAEAGVKTNLHIIISDKDSIFRFFDIFNKYKNIVDYFVLLPYTVAGRASEQKLDFDYLFKSLPEDCDQIAFGANFYPYLKENGLAKKFDISLYQPEILSKYLDLTNMKRYKSSFNLTEA